jgi:alanine racemase
MVRVGIGLYGLNPGPESPLPEGFRPAMTWKTTIAQVKTLPAGTYVGYGNTYRTHGTERIAVIAVGYADGFRRAPQTWGSVLVGGKFAPIVGRVSMDMTMIDVTDIPGVNIGDEVILVGKQGDAQITADDVAQQLGTNNYEVVSTILARVPRI